jgi:hypothetical protein
VLSLIASKIGTLEFPAAGTMAAAILEKTFVSSFGSINVLCQRHMEELVEFPWDGAIRNALVVVGVQLVYNPVDGKV